MTAPLPPEAFPTEDPDADSEGWIVWTGGEMPVPGDVEVRVQLECETRLAASKYVPRPASFWLKTWKRKSGDNRITHFRPATEDEGYNLFIRAKFGDAEAIRLRAEEMAAHKARKQAEADACRRFMGAAR